MMQEFPKITASVTWGKSTSGLLHKRHPSIRTCGHAVLIRRKPSYTQASRKLMLYLLYGDDMGPKP